MRQRAFACQYIAKIAEFDPRSTKLAPIAIAFPCKSFSDVAIRWHFGHWSLFSFRFPQCVSLRDGSNSRTTCRFNACMTPIRAIMVGPFVLDDQEQRFGCGLPSVELLFGLR
jgi:hypothetical protein